MTNLLCRIKKYRAALFAPWLFGCEARAIGVVTPCNLDGDCNLGEYCEQRGYCVSAANQPTDGSAPVVAIPNRAELGVTAIEDVRVSCNAGLDDCVTRASITVQNQGRADSAQAFHARVTFDPDQSIEVQKELSIPLPARAAVTFQVETPPGPSCAPGCEVCASIDAADDVENNALCSFTFIDGLPSQYDQALVAVDDFEDGDAEPQHAAFGTWSCYALTRATGKVECSAATTGYDSKFAFAVSFDLVDPPNLALPPDGVRSPGSVELLADVSGQSLDFSGVSALLFSARMESSPPGRQGQLVARLICGDGGTLDTRVLLDENWAEFALPLTRFVRTNSVGEGPCLTTIDGLLFDFGPTIQDTPRVSGRFWIDSIYLQ